jgi:hypothetical protein
MEVPEGVRRDNFRVLLTDVPPSLAALALDYLRQQQEKAIFQVPELFFSFFIAIILQRLANAAVFWSKGSSPKRLHLICQIGSHKHTSDY